MSRADAVRRSEIVTGQPPKDLADVRQEGGQTWDTTQLQADFEVIGFLAPYVVVRRKSDGQKGSLEFTHNPRQYFNFSPHQGGNAL